MIVGILKTGHANIKSLSNTLESLGHIVNDVSDHHELNHIDKLILPGVGAFPAVMSELERDDLASAIIKFASLKPLLGICLGMQLLMKSSTENGFSTGLSLVEGTVNSLPENLGPIPHIGWNEITEDEPSRLMLNIKNQANVYFVHSYHCTIKEDVSKIYTDFYGQKIIAGFQKENIFGVQFHPEKSQKVGNMILKNFLDYDCA